MVFWTDMFRFSVSRGIGAAAVAFWVLIGLSTVVAPTVVRAESSDATWVSLGLAGESVQAIGLSRTNALIIYAGTNEGQRGIYRTDDGGSTWEPFNNGLGELDLQYMVVEFGTSDSVVYTASIYSEHVWKTQDGGGTWHNRLTGSDCGNTQLVMDPGDASRLYVSNCDGVRRTENRADFTPWTLVGPIAAATVANPRIAISRSDPSAVYFIEDTTVYKSTDYGTTTTTQAAVVGPEEEVGIQYALTEVAVHSGNEDIVYIGTSTNGMFKSENGGQTWFAISHRLPNQGQGFDVRLLAVDPLDGDTVYIYGIASATATVELVTEESTGFWKTTDGGRSWASINADIPADLAINTIVVPETGMREPMIGTFEGVWRHSPVTANEGDLVKSAADPATSGTVYRIVDGQKRAFSSFNVFAGCQYRSQDVKLIPSWYLDAIPAGANHAPCSSAQDFAVAGGRLYTQAGPGTGAGFTVTDNLGIPFFTGYQSLGGPANLGFPISRRFYDGAFTLQVFQRGVLQWNPASRSVAILNLFDHLALRGADPWLLANRQVPSAADWSGDIGLPFEIAARRHLVILDRNEAIKNRFLANPLWLQDFGLPMGYADFGAVRVLRAQRAVLIERNGVVTIPNTGEIASAAGLIPLGAALPE